MNKPVFQGDLVRLTAIDAETDAADIARWSNDGVFERLLDSDPAKPRLPATVKEWIEKQEPRNNSYAFAIRTLTDDRLIGEAELDGIQWPHGDGWIGIGIGAREDWNKGYGTDAMNILLRFAFSELYLHRVSLNVFGYNQRAMRCYEKVGFSVEGRLRACLNRDGQRWDLIFMGILRDEWERFNHAGNA
jgi:RimJ/RimL family protein N-acetyltransferase